MTQYVSPEGLEKLKKELEERKGTLRSEITKKILAAKVLGDLSENAEYTDAKEAQALNEGRIAELEETIRDAILIGPHQKQEVVVIGSTVHVKSDKHGQQKFTIVGPAESDPLQGFISNESPLGSSFIGHKKGDSIEIKTPGGLVGYKIVEVI